ncbi:ribosomal protein S9/S16 [Colletotrichum gloeosporioides Cg-14]|uniref:Small ribosomal subunit protein uS9m n=1 Tax=Colletotrichum gloeosporioides (strain Cg-14) TaxID=1237896 RepID=T0JY91_COLGC|nr:ribosomal protein S9/S16 [Colletotrichum gloeosporioides Cg-14]
MSTIRHGLRQTLCLRQAAKSQHAKLQWQRPSIQVRIKSMSTSTPIEPPKKPPGNALPDLTALPPGFDIEKLTKSKLAKPLEDPFPGMVHARAVPVSPSYFSREPHFNDSFIKFSHLMEKYQHLPLSPPDMVPRQLWRTLKGYRTMHGEPVKAKPYSQLLAMIKHLHAIIPKLMPEDVKQALEGFKRDIDPFKNVAKVKPLDKHGRALGIGRRKTSSARAWVVEGTGEVLVNGKPLNEVFGRIHDRESAIWALRSTARTDKYNVWALVDGGGVTGQAEALTLAIAKAMLVHEPDLRRSLRKAGCITRDARRVERKKHGHLKARKSPTWVKR